ncbi:MAG: molybdenum cofactor guanylyltransferase [Bacillota bacterium]|mgnify:CR=1 FL=1|jgi:molybdopterin-guanine dinucleotide biosynthesis protein A|nr:molybdenum cofactor guanylyltransferase [Bacillota bacterium]
MAAMGDEVVGPVRKVIDDVGAVILAGGSGSRLGGNKALLPLAGAPMAQHVLDVVAGLVDRVVVVGNTMEEAKTVIAGLKWPDGVAAVPADDGVGERQGPLAGIRAGLAACGRARCLVVGCDMPFLCRGVLEALIGLSQGHDAAAPRLGPVRATEPLCAVYEVRCVGVIDALLASGTAKVTRLLDAVDTVYMEAEECSKLDPAGLGFFNVNTWEDVAAAEGVIMRSRCARAGCGRG